MKPVKILICSIIGVCALQAQNEFEPDDVVEVEFKIGDHSESHSERWKMDVSGATPAQIQSADYGEVTTKTYNQYRKGNTYDITISHVGTHKTYTASTQDSTRQTKYEGISWYGHSSPDYDYTGNVEVMTSGVGWIIEEDDENDPLLTISGASSTNAASGKTAKLHIVKVELPEEYFGKPNDSTDLQPDRIIGNDVEMPSSFPSIPEDEHSVTIIFDITPQAVLDNFIDEFSFEVAASVPIDFGATGNGSIDDTDFVSSKGNDPIIYAAKEEFLSDKAWDNPRLRPQTISISFDFDGIEIFLLEATDEYYPILVLGRFNYLSSAYQDRHSEAIEFSLFKFGMSDLAANYPIEYSSTIGVAGATTVDSYVFGTIPTLDKIYLGDPAFVGDAKMASVAVHEMSHWDDGKWFVASMSRGLETWNDWKSGNFTATLTLDEVDDIVALASGEIESSLDQMADVTWQYLSPDQQLDVTDYIADHQVMLDILTANGYLP